MSRIKINKTSVRSVGQRLNENASDIRHLKMIVNDIVNDMSTAWEGTDYDAMRDKVTDKFLPSLEKSSEAIDGLGNYLKKVPAGYESLDSVFKIKKIVD